MNPALLNALTSVAVIVLPVVGGMLVLALRKLAVKWGLEATATNTANMESEIRAALNVGITGVLPLVVSKGWSSSEVRAEILAAATAYLQQRFPDRAAQIVTAAAAENDTAAGQSAAIHETLSARLPQAVLSASMSPATPPMGQIPIFNGIGPFQPGVTQ